MMSQTVTYGGRGLVGTSLSRATVTVTSHRGPVQVVERRTYSVR